MLDTHKATLRSQAPVRAQLPWVGAPAPVPTSSLGPVPLSVTHPRALALPFRPDL